MAEIVGGLRHGFGARVPLSRVYFRHAAPRGMSERSLRRALAEEGTSYRTLLDELRRYVAAELLSAKRRVTEVSFLLGFSETSALSRAFRRWHGTSARDAKRIGG